MLPDVRQAQGPRIADQLAENAMAARRLAQRESRVVVDPDGDEAFQRVPARVEHAQRGVARAGQLARHREHPLEDGLELRLLEHAPAELDQRVERPILHGR